MKKLLTLLGALLFIFVIAVITIPLFVDVDHYRPQIIEAANKNMNGKLELGKLKLSLWGSIKVHAESIKLTINGYPRPFLDTNRFHLEIPFTSILSFHPQIIAVLDSPKVQLEKNSSGEMNVMKLLKTASIDLRSTTTKDTAQIHFSLFPLAHAETKENQASSPAVPAFLTGASLGVRLEKGDILYTDQQTNASYQLNGLNLDLKDLGLSSTMHLKFSTPLKGASPTMKFEGELSGEGVVKPIVSNGAVRSASGEVFLDASKLAFELNKGLLKKSAKMPLSFKAIFAGTDKDLLFKNIELNFSDYKIFSKGLFILAPNMSAKFEVNSDSIALDKLEELVPMLKAYQLKGTANLMSTVESNGTVHKAKGDIKLNGGEFFMAEYFRATMKINSQLGFTENSINFVKTDISAPDTELSMQGSVNNFASPQFNIIVNGKSLDADKLMILADAKHSQPSNNKSFSFVSEAQAATSQKKSSDVNPFAAMALNPVFAKASGYLSATIAKVVAKGVVMENVIVKSQLQNMNLKVATGSFKAFGGNINSTGDFDLRSPALIYKSVGKLNGVSAKEAFTAYFPKYQNTIDGKLDADWNISGYTYPEAARMKSLKGNAKLIASDGNLRTVDIQETIASSMAKIPFLKNAKAPKIDGGFKTLSADLTFKDGNTQVDPFKMISRGKGVEVRGKAFIQESLEHESFLDVYDPNGVLPKEISKGSNAVAVSFRFTGPVSSPRADYDYTVKKLAAGSGKDMAKAALKKALGAGSESGEDPLKGLSDKLKKKIKFF